MSSVAQAILLALGHHRAGRFDDARRVCRVCLAFDPANPDALQVLALTAGGLGRWEEAGAMLRRAIAVNGALAPLHNSLGNALQRLRRFPDAEACYRRAVALDPGFAEALYNRGITLWEQGRLAAAVRDYRRALTARPDYTKAYNNLGNALSNLERGAEAQTAYRAALALVPGSEEVLLNLGALAARGGRDDEAEALFRRALAANPGFAEAHTELGMLRLAKGSFRDGFAEFEWRRREAVWRSQAPQLPGKPWAGEPLDGRTILLHAEQGFGDTIQFCRFAPRLRQLGARVLLLCPKPLRRLLDSLPGIDGVVAAGEPLPAFDVHLPLLSLPAALGTTLETIPAGIPYLQPDPAAAAAWRQRLGAHEGLKVGLVWAGAARRHDIAASLVDRRRSLDLAQLRPLAGVKGVRFVSLQVGEAAAQAGGWPADSALIDPTAGVGDFADTAAVVANLDLVISVDTAVAHLAGALGRPVWLLSRFDGCWRWLRGRADSPWYPTLRVFRQPSPGDWPAVVRRVAAELESRTAGGIRP
ncbi:tetratricopeptide repeat-containing glycosyltransferase family protein [Azospirillum sp. TSO22-1]|uniref:tetratricopeptide repeat-containing glycosyltransferase family protein n=1 Tax=Azospirillum sp. TSO22-1 TaxID=716789 RepID=UPI000D64162D|nr:tetratricopeptide repeat-containing glycosyltransferase family protein [Azospirillum sp. TSO22-1]